MSGRIGKENKKKKKKEEEDEEEEEEEEEEEMMVVVVGVISGFQAPTEDIRVTMERHFETYHDELCHGWEQKVNSNGVIYYVNDELHKTSWNHPYLDKVFKDLAFLFAEIKYAAYRTALKLRTLQLQFGLEKITVQGLKETFLLGSEGDGDETEPLTYEQMLLLIEKSLLSSRGLNTGEENVSQTADLILNFMANIYDKGHSGKLGPRCIQNALAALCGSKLHEKYKFFCIRLQNQHGKIPRENLTHLIDDLMQIPGIVKEGRAFGIDVAAAVDSCFSKSQCVEAEDVSQDCFLAWLCQEPQTLVWLPTLHRLIATQHVQHDARCSVCNDQPITGFRYKCLVCFGYNLCQNCFLRGCVSLSHKHIHRVKEYCLPVSCKDVAKAWMAIVKNKLLRRHSGRPKMVYLKVEGRKQETLLNWEPVSIQVDHMTSACNPADRSNSEEGAIASVERDEAACTRTVSTDKRFSKPLMLIGQPSDNSSPIVTVTQEQNDLPQQDIQHQQKLMALRIKELQQENKILKEKIREYQESGIVEKSKQAEASIALENSKEITADSPISPISDQSKEAGTELMATAHSDEASKLGHDTLAIVGAFTPVRGVDPPIIKVEPSTPQSNGRSFLEHDHTDCTRPDGLQYRSSDMSLLSASDSDSSSHSVASNHMESTGANLTGSSDEVNDYKPSDMSILCSGLAKHAAVVGTSDENSVPALDSNDQKCRLNLVYHSPSTVEQSDDFLRSSTDSDNELSGHDTSRNVDPVLVTLGSGVEISNIQPDMFFTPDSKELLSLVQTPEQFAVESRRRTIEPVHMSTPVSSLTTAKHAKSLENICQLKTKKSHVLANNKLELTEDKENETPQREPVKTPSGLHPRKTKSAERTGVLTNSNHFHKCNSELEKTDEVDSRSFATLNKNSSYKRNSKAMLTQDRDELNQIMADFERECKISDITQSNGTRVMTVNDSSVMAAAFNIGDALSEFVQAVAKCDIDGNVSEVTEMTKF
ncbi:dystrophin [Plakobranchus ocellatus]|uniref:Dystrophin n=1 Tax=Plakobranchus ocellatus TaxID=259542 RepID=A0AAV3ZIR0_9GAST|nr:dystrophin [Plakobranchus ocellatus]